MRLELGQLSRSHLTAFPGELERAVLVQAAPNPIREIDRLQILEPFDVRAVDPLVAARDGFCADALDDGQDRSLAEALNQHARQHGAFVGLP